MSNFDLIAICIVVLILAILLGSVTLAHITALTDRARMAAATRRANARARLAADEAARVSLKAPLRTAKWVTLHTHQPDDLTFYGMVIGDYEDRLILDHTHVIEGQDKLPVPGVQHFAHTEIAWIDVHPNGTRARAQEADASTEV